VAGGAALGSLAAAALGAVVLATGVPLTATAAFLPLTGLVLRLDGLGAFFLVLIGLVGVAAAVYGFGYSAAYAGRYSLRMLGAMVNVLLLALTVQVMADNPLTFLLAWEIVSLSAYFAVLTEHDTPGTVRAANWYLGVTHVGFAALVVGLYALMVSYFATSRRGIYFALLTLIFAEVVYTFFRYTQTFGGSDGIQGLPAPRLLPGLAIDSPLRNYYLILVYLALAWILCRLLVASHFGRVLVAIRENEDRARFLGYNVQKYKMAVCMISALLTGIGGALYPGRSAFATPDLMLWTISGEFIIMVMIGGLGTLVGPIIGGAFFIILQEKVSSYVDWYFIVIGLVLIAIVLFMPKGLLGLRRLFRLRPWRATA
jgi:ABC-type branched-subunit amino acid transport system permease subunit